jgi:hypothetical protein
MMTYIVQKGRWCNIIVWNVHIPIEDKSDDSKDIFYEELEQVLKKFPKYHMKADDVNIMRGSVQIVKENAEALVVATKEIGLAVNADKTKYTVMARDQNAGRSHGMKIDNSSTERVEEFKYLGTTLLIYLLTYLLTYSMEQNPS